MVCVLCRVVSNVLEGRTGENRVHVNLPLGVVVHVEGKSFTRRNCARRFERWLDQNSKLDCDRPTLDFA
jgi:hypothetical protein